MKAQIHPEIQSKLAEIAAEVEEELLNIKKNSLHRAVRAVSRDQRRQGADKHMTSLLEEWIENMREQKQKEGEQ